MHLLRLVLFHVVPLILAVAAPVLLLWAWGNGLPLLPALLVGLLFLSAAVIIYLAGALQQPSHAQVDDIENLWAEISRLREQLRQLSASKEASGQDACSTSRPDEQPRAVPAPAHGAPSTEAASSAAASSSAASSSATSSSTASCAAPHADAGTPPSPQWQATAPSGLEAPAGYVLYMEAVHDPAKGDEVVFYRAMPTLPAEEGRIYPARHAQIRARLLGLAGGLQAQMLRDSLAFLRELRAAQGSLMVICPLDAATLGRGQTSAVLQEMLLTAGAVARDGLLLAVAQEDLGMISREAREQLMMLSGHVAGWVLDCNRLPDAQAPLPLSLHVGHVDVPATVLEQLAGLGDFTERVHALQGRGWRIVANGVETKAQLALAQRFGALARGRMLAAPRRLRLPEKRAHQADNAAADTQRQQAVVPDMPGAAQHRVAAMP